MPNQVVDTVFNKWLRGSTTLLLHSGLVGASVVMQAMVEFPDVATSVGLQQFIPPAHLPAYTMAIAGCTIVARLRRLPPAQGNTNAPDPAGPSPRTG